MIVNIQKETKKQTKNTEVMTSSKDKSKGNIAVVLNGNNEIMMNNRVVGKQGQILKINIL